MGSGNTVKSVNAIGDIFIMPVKENRITVRLDDELADMLNELVRRSGLSQATVLRILVRTGFQYNLLSDDWQQKLLADKMELYEKQQKVKLKGFAFQHDLKETSRDKDRQQEFNLVVFKEYMKTCSEEEKTHIFNQVFQLDKRLKGEIPDRLPYITENKPDEIHVFINAKEVIVKELLKDGRPKITFNQDRLVECIQGFHTKHSYCSSCPDVNNCPTLREEALERLNR